MRTEARSLDAATVLSGAIQERFLDSASRQRSKSTTSEKKGAGCSARNDGPLNFTQARTGQSNYPSLRFLAFNVLGDTWWILVSRKEGG